MERPPCDLVCRHRFLDRCLIGVAVHAHDRERFIPETHRDRPLVRDHLHARRTPSRPEGKQQNFAVVFREFHRPTVQIHANNLRCRLANSAKPHSFQPLYCLVTKPLFDALVVVIVLPIEFLKKLRVEFFRLCLTPRGSFDNRSQRELRSALNLTNLVRLKNRP